MAILEYDVPAAPLLLTISSFLYLLNISEALFTRLINAGLVGSLAVGIIFGPQAANIVPLDVMQTFIILGYIGVIILVFEGGLSTNISLLFGNIFLSAAVALTGILLPIAFSLLLLHFGYGYTPLQAFGAGAALCSTSLGTTLALLRPDLRQTKTGSVLMTAALLDDVAGLVIAAIIPNLTSKNTGGSTNSISWQTITRPILVSLAFAFITPLMAYILRLGLLRLRLAWRQALHTGHVQLFLIIITLSSFVAGARYADTSELFGAYLAGAFLSHVFKTVPPNTDDRALQIPHEAFSVYILPFLQVFLSPLFFASIGAALPIRSLISVDGSHRVVWRGIIYSFLMVFAKAAVGGWMLIWPDQYFCWGWCGRRKKPSKEKKPPTAEKRQVSGEGSSGGFQAEVLSAELPRLRSAALLGLAMVARGEIALIVAQLARPLLIPDQSQGNSEPFAVVIWAILVSTVGGATGVGLLIKSWDG